MDSMLITADTVTVFDIQQLPLKEKVFSLRQIKHGVSAMGLKGCRWGNKITVANQLETHILDDCQLRVDTEYKVFVYVEDEAGSAAGGSSQNFLLPRTSKFTFFAAFPPLLRRWNGF